VPFRIFRRTVGTDTEVFTMSNSNGDIALNNKHAFRSNDSWLRLNQDAGFSSGTYTPGFFRVDGGIASGGVNSLGGGTIHATSEIRGTLFSDYNNSGFYLDPASVSILNDIRPSIMYDRDNTGYYVDPANFSEMNTISYGAATGNGAGTVRLHDGDNNIWFDWTGSQLRMMVDVTNVKNFIIQHPDQKDKYLIHTTLEGPENGVYYRGKGELIDGKCKIVLPEYFNSLTLDGSATVILTPKGKKPFLLSYDNFIGNEFWVYADVVSGSFDWEVKAERQDVKKLLVEPDKNQIEVKGDGPYKYYNIINHSVSK
jgi:hypothetical protein